VTAPGVLALICRSRGAWTAGSFTDSIVGLRGPESELDADHLGLWVWSCRRRESCADLSHRDSGLTRTVFGDHLPED
jgi:hypothetical protein